MMLESVVEVVRIVQETKVRKGRIATPISSPNEVANLASFYIGDEDREVLLVIGLNTKNKINMINRAHMGSLSSSIVTPREVFKPLILNNCASFVICHNHPSADLRPSSEDIQLTQRFVEVGDLMGIKLLDHLIVNNETGFLSLKTEGLF
ncbi:RadC family protein [Exiguobacterium sp. S90]|uniref:JAB domain-containing protein n=1 Tax=Exiguobacterium sp. S90 TaxID=1221231 RepID=UPI002036AD7D|nr:JAB domain-containing protein [Exiguobacterium sp. S90]